MMFGAECLACEYFDVCRSGCTSMRATPQGTFTDKYYYCEMSQRVISHIRADVVGKLQKSGLTIERPASSRGCSSGCAAQA